MDGSGGGHEPSKVIEAWRRQDGATL